MMMRRKFLLLALMLLLISVGIVIAQSSSNYTSQRFVTVSGGSADSAHYKITSVLGQPATGLGNSQTYKVSDGFLYPLQSGSDFNLWLPIVIK